jgi:hypothetical protein
MRGCILCFSSNINRGWTLMNADTDVWHCEEIAVRIRVHPFTGPAQPARVSGRVLQVFEFSFIVY